MSLESLILNMSGPAIAKQIKYWEAELSHCNQCEDDPIEALEWLDLYRAERARRYPTRWELKHPWSRP